MSEVKVFVMPEDLRMDAYYYSFYPTGVRIVDELLSAIAIAGKHNHHTDRWDDNLPGHDFSYIDLIQEMAERVATALCGGPARKDET